MYFTSGNDRAFEQPQPRPEQPDEAAPGLENSVLENPTSDNPTPGNPTLENPMQLNKDAVLIRNISGAADIAGAIWGCMGYTVLLCFCLFKTGSISKSVFGAH